MQVGRGSQVGRDTVQSQDVEEVLADSRIDVANDGVLGGHQTVVTSAVPCLTRAHVGPLNLSTPS
jgi:hypothetical protein